MTFRELQMKWAEDDFALATIDLEGALAQLCDIIYKALNLRITSGDMSRLLDDKGRR